jgi:hypothetical protein
MSPEEIQSWKDLKVEVCLYIKPKEPFWLVAKYTDKDRAEISIDDFVVQEAAIKLLLEAFPGAKIDTVIKPKVKK